MLRRRNPNSRLLLSGLTFIGKVLPIPIRPTAGVVERVVDVFLLVMTLPRRNPNSRLLLSGLTLSAKCCLFLSVPPLERWDES
jgi:hypothetical protein